MSYKLWLISIAALSLLLGYFTVFGADPVRRISRALDANERGYVPPQTQLPAQAPKTHDEAAEEVRAEDDSNKLRAQVEEKIEKDAARITSIPELDAYLDELTLQATERGAVTDLEVNPGMAAIENHADQLGAQAAIEKQVEFGLRMTRLSRRLQGLPSEPGPPPAPDMDHLAMKVVQAASESELNQAVNDYVRGAGDIMDERERARALQELMTLRETIPELDSDSTLAEPVEPSVSSN